MLQFCWSPRSTLTFKLGESYFRREFSCNLRQKLAAIIPAERNIAQNFRKQYGSNKIGEITVNMIYKGMQGMPGLLYETSVMDKDKGVYFRGFNIPECMRLLPSSENGEEPLPEGIFWLLLTGEIPSKDQVKELSCDWAARSALPKHVVSILKCLPSSMHPLSQLSIAVIALENDSKFTKAVKSGTLKNKYWEYAYEDSMDLIAKLPVIAATIYNNTYSCGKGSICVDRTLDWSANFVRMLGNEKPGCTEMMRLYFTIHCDDGGGNVFSHATNLVGSALCNPYVALASGLNGLSGPLNGVANQEVVIWLLSIERELGKNPEKEKLVHFVQNFINSGKMVPGYGQGDLRRTDPRFTCQHEFGLKHLLDNNMFQLINSLHEIIPPILQACKLENSWPNTNALSDVLLYCYGMNELNFNPVLFGISRALGVLASLIWSRALGLPLERPKSVSTCCLMKMVTS